uniref:Uncharacterized protein n=1 Tax=Vespula pensylvanica TaxID=30213 RepID=A0A834KS30_VESPE|nr:hypothetical protein H0235_013993 [Vespula pensylvanica]
MEEEEKGKVKEEEEVGWSEFIASLGKVGSRVEPWPGLATTVGSTDIEKVARAIVNMPIPIRTSSGHVRDEGTTPFAKLTALDPDLEILYAFVDLTTAILRSLSRKLGTFLSSP